MNKSEQLLSPKQILSALLFAGILALSAVSEAKAATPTNPTDTTSTTIATPDPTTPNTRGVSGDVLCKVDGNLYSINGNTPIPENCNDEPVTTLVSPPPSELPDTGINFGIGEIGGVVTVGGAALLGMSKHRMSRKTTTASQLS